MLAAGKLHVVVVSAGFSVRMLDADHQNMCEQNNGGGVVMSVSGRRRSYNTAVKCKYHDGKTVFSIIG